MFSRTLRTLPWPLRRPAKNRYFKYDEASQQDIREFKRMQDELRLAREQRRLTITCNRHFDL